MPESTDRTRKTVLPNGIRVVTEHMPHVRSVTMGVWVWSGTRFEPAEKPGIAHFLEHAVFKGTEKRNAYQIAQSIESLGGYLNAFTGRELNCYFARVMDSHLPVAVDVIGDLLQSSKFDPHEIEKEKMVVIEEIHGLEDNPEDLVSELYANLIWQPHPLSRPILGNAPSVSSFTRNHLVAYLAARYRNDHVYTSSRRAAWTTRPWSISCGSSTISPAKVSMRIRMSTRMSTWMPMRRSTWMPTGTSGSVRRGIRSGKAA